MVEQVEDPWGAFADDQLGLMDHLGIDRFFVMGLCIGGPFVLKLLERAPERVLAGVLCQPVGSNSASPVRLNASFSYRLPLEQI